MTKPSLSQTFRHGLPEDHALAMLTTAETAATIVAIAGYYQMLALFLSAALADHPVRRVATP